MKRNFVKVIAPALLAAGIALGQAQAPIFELDPSWPKIPAKWKMGDASSIAVDKQDHLWVLSRPRTVPAADAAKAAPPVTVFDAAGNFIKSWGGDGAGYDWPQREHGILIDGKGNVWLAGNNCAGRNLPGLKDVGDDQYLKFTQDGKFLLQVGKPSGNTGNADTKSFRQPADASYYAKNNEIFVADGYGNHRVIVIDADTGGYKRMWGAYGNKPVDSAPCPPVTLKSVPPGDGPQQFSIVHSIRVSSDGMVYVADRENRRVQVFTADGKFVKQVIKHDTPFARNVALSPDQRFLYVGDEKSIHVYDRKSMELLTTITGGGLIGGGHEMQTDSKGNLYVALTGRGLQKLTFKGLGPAKATTSASR